MKFLFTSDNLSVQVHPGDEYARTHHDSRGKTEMWHVLRAEPDAKIAVSLKRETTPNELLDASLSGAIMDLLNWVPAKAGDCFFTPAGTIHALGAGLVVCEIQQHSDVTYRLYDYGRPRELHLDHGITVSDLKPYDAFVAPKELTSGKQLLAECGYFRTERWEVAGTLPCPAPDRTTIYIAVAGAGNFAGEPFETGMAFEAQPGIEPFEIQSDGATFVITSE